MEKANHSEETAMDRLLRQRLQQCLDLHEHSVSPTDGELYCSRTFDGWSCWNDTPAGHIAHTPCPYFITGFDSRRMAHKVCNEDGTWFRHPDSNQTWSNYTTCVDLDDLKWRQNINTLYITGYTVSLVALLLSLFIFFYFRSLKCTRITIHKNLFIAFICNNSMWLIWYKEIVSQPDVVLENGPVCQILHVFVQYFLVTSYFWMFCEGLYLHTLLVVAFASEERIMYACYGVGWGVPAIFIIIYAACRGSLREERTSCWIEESHYTWILSIPVAISMLTNLIFLINIVRLLVTKLRSGACRPTSDPCPSSIKKAVRATLILIPLLGLHYLVTPFRPEPHSSMESVYEVVSAITSSFQGLCVATLFCFCNGEVTSQVLAHVKKKWNQLLLLNDKGPNSYAATTVSFVKSTAYHDGGSYGATDEMV